MSDQLDQLDYYTLLGVDLGASVDDVKRAFRRFARRYHPDRFAGADAEKQERATRIYRRGSEAYQTLTDLEARRAYDVLLARGETRLRDDPRYVRAAPPPNQAAPAPTALPIRSPAAKALFERAQLLARSGDINGAYKALRGALEQEPESALIEAALEKIAAQMRRR